jgi:DNA-binding transcriptional MerR regulator
MEKSPDAFRTISEVAEALDLPAHVLRFWETRFSQVKPVKRGGGRRYYRPDDVRLLRGIRGLLYDEGLTIKGVQKILRERGVRHVIGLGSVPEGEDAAMAAAPVPARPQPRAAQPRARTNGEAKAHAAGKQPDLFAAPATAPAVERQEAPPAPERPLKPLDRPALRALLTELEALREVMVSDQPK